jgi:hypothetical protein
MEADAMDKKSEWNKKNCKFAQGQQPQDVPGKMGTNHENPSAPLPPDSKKKVAEIFDALIHEGLGPKVTVKRYSIDPGEKSSWDEWHGGTPGYPAYVEDLDATMSLKGINLIDLNDEDIATLGFPDVETTYKAFQQALPVEVTARSTTKAGGYDNWGEFDGFYLDVSGPVTITGLGPLQPDGKCQFMYSPEPIVIDNWEEKD